MLRWAVVLALCALSSGCCILTYCGPPAIGATCDAGGGCPGTDRCDTTTVPGTGWCTRTCSGPGYFTGCQFSGDTGDGYCGMSLADGSLQCLPSCFDGGFSGRGCPVGFRCSNVDGGALTDSSGVCMP